MLVSYAHNLIFLKSRKTAGTSVEMFLQQACGITHGPPSEATRAIVNRRGIVGRRRTARPNLIPWRNKWQNHMPAPQMRVALGEDFWQSACKITTVRNPFDRCISGFFWRRYGGKTPPTDLSILRAGVEDFCLIKKFSDDRDIYYDRGAFVPDVCLRYENLENDLRAFCSEHGIDTSKCALPRTKMTGGKRGGYALAEFFTPRAIQAVQQSYGWAFDRFGYAPTPPQATCLTPATLSATTDPPLIPIAAPDSAASSDQRNPKGGFSYD